ncbi:hypothetical protein MRX96_019175 [Rhipicephalus microplus]
MRNAALRALALPRVSGSKSCSAAQEPWVRTRFPSPVAARRHWYGCIGRDRAARVRAHMRSPREVVRKCGVTKPFGEPNIV